MCREKRIRHTIAGMKFFRGMRNDCVTYLDLGQREEIFQ